MGTIWTVLVSSIYLFITCRSFERIVFPGTDIVCKHPSVIQVMKVSLEEETGCKRHQCTLSNDDYHTIKQKCDNQSECRFDVALQTSCLWDYADIRFTYLCEAPQSLACNFELDLCGWSPVDKETRNWTVNGNGNVWDGTGPDDDSTKGRYISCGGISSVKCQLSSVDVKSSHGRCLTFWYYIKEATLIVIVNNKTSAKISSHKLENYTHNKHNTEWKKGVVDVNITGLYELVFEGETKKKKSEIRLDDIDFFDYPCPNDQDIERKVFVCTFEKDTCDMKQINEESTVNWNRGHGEDSNSRPRPWKDHTTGSETGRYMFIDTDDNNKTGSMAIPAFNIRGRKCLTFWYYANGDGEHSFNLHILNSETVQKFEITINDLQHDRWTEVRKSIAVNQNDQIVIKGILPKGPSGITVDDISVVDGLCTEDEYFDVCLNTSSENILGCSTLYLSKEKISFTRDPVAECLNVETSMEQAISKVCRQNLFEKCKFTVQDIMENRYDCINSTTNIVVDYNCINNSEKTGSSNVADDSESTVSSNAAGLIAGVIVAVSVIVVLIVVLIFIRRRSLSSCENTKEKVHSNNNGDYIGHQNIELSVTNGYVKKGKITKQNDSFDSRHDDQHYSEIKDQFQKEVIDDNQHEYIDIYPENNTAEQITPVVQPQQHDTGYACLDPAATDFNHIKTAKQEMENVNRSERNTCLFINSNNLDESEIDTKTSDPITSENYTILDPNETGFDRSKYPKHRASPYELAKPIQKHENDPYFLSKEGEYDSTSKIRHKETDENVYSHSVENVYDSARFTRDKDGKDDTYDHFFGQKTEDDYDISKS